MAKLDESTLEAVNNANFKAMAESTTVSLNLATQNAVQHQAAMNQIREVALQRFVTESNEVGSTEALALVKANTGNDLAGIMSQLGAAIASIQQSMKGAQSTPPETAKP
tara:strand:+ start:8291 stop:8617 length:327 start_codon:yes stop_codon:yes gene_type:complete